MDDEVRHAHWVLAQAHQSFDWDWPGAEHEFRRELAVNPGNAEARGLFGLFLLGLGDHSGALRETHRAIDTDPLSPLAHHMRAWVLLEIDRVEDAVREARHGVQVSGGFTHAYWSLGAGLSLAQRHQEATDTLREARRLAPGDPNTLGMLGWACARANLEDEATDIAKQLEDHHGGLAAPFIATVFVGLDDHDQAFRWLSRGCDERAGFMCFVPSLVVWRPLRSDPRFQALLRRMNFPETADGGDTSANTP